MASYLSYFFGTFLYLMFFVCLSGYGQYVTYNTIKYDSVVVRKVVDSRNAIYTFEEVPRDTFYIEKQITLHPRDADELTKRIFRRSSYGNKHYAQMVFCETEIYYYLNGRLVHSIVFELSANHFFASFSLKQQNRGRYIIGNFYTKSGIRKKFKKHLAALLIKYGILDVHDDVFFFDKQG